MGVLADQSVADRRRPERLIFIAPRPADSGVGDHADRLLEALRPHADETVEVRCGGAGDDGVRECIRLRRRVSKALRGADRRRTVVHAELSGGSVGPFWALVGRPGVVRTAMVHEPPRPVWSIFRFRLIARNRLVDNAIHWALDRGIVALERWGTRHVGLVSTSSQGSSALAERGFGRQVVDARLLPLAYPPLPPLANRPLAVGLFGYHYRGKGFEIVDQLRALLDDRIEIVIAGYGTEAIPQRPGVRVCGAVSDAAEADFFAGIRLLLLPYRRKVVWGTAMAPASGSFVEAAAFGTPCLALASAGLHALEGSGCESAQDLATLAERVEKLIDDGQELDRLASELECFRSRQTLARTIDPIVSQWSLA